MGKKMNPDKIPPTDSIQELASYWDSHDLTDHEDELEEVEDQVFEPRIVVRVPLGMDEAAAVKQLAESEGVAPGDLIGKWVREKVKR
jgi:hypothetical protein